VDSLGYDSAFHDHDHLLDEIERMTMPEQRIEIYEGVNGSKI
jgi:hypothetical protein